MTDFIPRVELIDWQAYLKVTARLGVGKAEAELCEPSKLADDWVVKGCHVHIEGVELRLSFSRSSVLRGFSHSTNFGTSRSFANCARRLRMV